MTSRSVTLDAPLAHVWDELTDADSLADWLGIRIDGPMEPGRLGVHDEDGVRRRVRVLDVETESSISWEWAADGDPESRSIVSIQVDGDGDSTIVTVTETRGATASCSVAEVGSDSWSQRLLGLELRFLGARTLATV